jgi:hypothetical protein
MSNKLHLYAAMQKGFAVKQQKDKEHRAANPGGDFRGGNSGCMTEDGRIIGSSPRTAVLRHLGIEIPTTLDDELIFHAGYSNENQWVDLLELAGVPTKQEEEIPIVWSLPDGSTITGRPDMVVMKDEDNEQPLYGIELKLISSNGKMVRHAHFGLANPIPYQVCQSAHYSSKMGVDWVLAYTNRAHFTSFYFGASNWQFNREEIEPHRSCIVDDKSGKVVNVKPFISLYDITWDGDTCLVDGKPTIITASGIERFYQYCSDCVRDKVIPSHGDTLDIWGVKEKKQSPHVMYDDFAEASTNMGFDQWVIECREIAEGVLV